MFSRFFDDAMLYFCRGLKSSTIATKKALLLVRG